MRQVDFTSLPRLGLHPKLRTWGLSFVMAGVAGVAICAGQTPTPQTPQTPPESLPPRFSITGKVINSITGSPVARAQVSASPMNGRPSSSRGAARLTGQTGSSQTGSSQTGSSQDATVVTGSGGEFSITVPSAGGWRLTAAAHGYHRQAFEEHDGFSTAIMLSETQPAYRLVFPLPPAAAIAGYVLDEAGEAVRNGELSISLVPPPTPDNPSPRPQHRGTQRTDDRGYFKFTELSPGAYDLRLQAQPWYAASAGRFGGFEGSAGIGGVAGFAGGGVVTVHGAEEGSPEPDPLDVTYPVVWYPGTTEYASATPIALGVGETREVDFRLSPIPAYHLRLPSTTPSSSDGRGHEVPAIQPGVYLTEVFPDGNETIVPASTHIDPEGNQDLSGLAPGTYVVHRQRERTPSTAIETTVQISSNSPRTVDFSQGTPATMVTVKIDPADESQSVQVIFRDVATGRVRSAQRSPEGRREQRRSPVPSGGEATPAKEGSPVDEDRSVSLDPGRYAVSLNGGGDLHLTGIDATGADATGRIVTVDGGSPTLRLHVAHGRASVTGFVRFHGRADAGAMVLLVPVTLGDPAGLNIIRRDQSNSDGSFDLNGILPGAYILVAIDHGWDVKWNDPATLRHYLMQGVPLDLTRMPGKPQDVKETIDAQGP